MSNGFFRPSRAHRPSPIPLSVTQASFAPIRGAFVAGKLSGRCWFMAPSALWLACQVHVEGSPVDEPYGKRTKEMDHVLIRPPMVMPHYRPNQSTDCQLFGLTLF